MKLDTKGAFNIPNILCYFRILLIPLFSYFLLTADEETPNRYYLAALFILLSGLTDFLDGFIARRFNMITELGKALDPIADKMTQFMIAICLAIKVKYVIILVLIVFVKELFMGVCCLVLLRRNKRLDGAKWFGKTATFVYYVAMFLVIVFPNMGESMAMLLIALVSFFVLLSFALYIPVFYKMLKTQQDCILPE